jgi:hypothetical protein
VTPLIARLHSDEALDRADAAQSDDGSMDVRQLGRDFVELEYECRAHWDVAFAQRDQIDRLNAILAEVRERCAQLDVAFQAELLVVEDLRAQLGKTEQWQEASL